MDIENNESGQLTYKLFRTYQIVLVSLLGTALAGMIAITLNYRSLGSKRACLISSACTFIFLPIYVFIFMSLRSSSYDRFFPIFVAMILGFLSYFFQKNHIDESIQKGAVKQTKWNLFLLILVGLAGTFLLLFLLVLFKG